jgi:hypothetical protein
MDDIIKILTSDITSITIDDGRLIMIKKIGSFGKITEHQMGEYSKIISNLKEFKIRGTSKPPKLEKYVKLSQDAGFKIDKKSIKNAGFEGKNKDVLNYYIIFKK